MTDDITKLKAKIERARGGLKQVCTARANLAGVLANCPGVAGVEFEFPKPDTAHVYQTMFGRRMEKPMSVYRLSFGEPLRWVGISHPWGVKPADITVMREAEKAWQ